MTDLRKLDQAIDKLSDFRNDTFELVDSYMSFIRPMLEKARELKDKEESEVSNLNNDERALLRYFDSRFQEFEKSLDIISKYNDSVSENYIKGMNLLSSAKKDIVNERK